MTQCYGLFQNPVSFGTVAQKIFSGHARKIRINFLRFLDLLACFCVFWLDIMILIILVNGGKYES